MSKRFISKRLSVILGLAAAIALFAGVGSAAAAGPPIVETSPAEGLGNLSIIRVNGKVNPNGATTTYWYEYSTDGVTYSSTPHEAYVSEKIGRTIWGLFPNTYYKYRVVASNKFGTTQGNVKERRTTRWDEYYKAPEEIATSGKLTINFEPGWPGAIVTCNESGSGVVAHTITSEDSYTSNYSGCELFISGKKKCNWPSFSIKFGGNLLPVNPTIKWHTKYAECVFIGEEIESTFIEPVEVTPSLEPAKPLPVSWSGKAAVLGHIITFTGTGTWENNGVWAAEKIKFQ